MKMIAPVLFVVFASVAIAANASVSCVSLDGEWQFRREGGVAWRSVTVPHDWSMAEAVREDAPSKAGGGFYPCGRGEYRKTFVLADEDIAKNLQLHFEGVYRDAVVRVNGREAGRGTFYGYVGFRVGLDGLVKAGDNEVVVAVDNSAQPNCRWYTGSGIYRHVRLEKRDWPYVEPDSVVVRAQANGEVVISGTLVAKDGSRSAATENLKIADPILWTPETPKLYDAEFHGERVRFGFREVEWSAKDGLVLNGETIKLHGACVHHDHGPLGAASFDDAEYRKARQLKAAGFNAVRTSHNPVSEAFLDACDELGLVVMDDMFDGWRSKKNPCDYGAAFDEDWRRDLSAIVRRDRNHPSVIIWSIGNEIYERMEPQAVEQATAMKRVVDELDGTRPVTQALACWHPQKWEDEDALAAAHDIAGYNYMEHMSECDHERCPDRVIVYTETYPKDATEVWRRIVAHPYVIGEFVWTGIDYLGEAAIGRTYYKGMEPDGEHYANWPKFPWHGACCGDIDLTGWRRPVSHLRETLWNENAATYICAVEPSGWKGEIKTTHWSVPFAWEHWNFEGWEGRPVRVEVYTRKPHVTLLLNGKIIGEADVGAATAWTAKFTVPYEKGVVTAVASDGSGSEAASLHTADTPSRVRFATDYAGKELTWVVGTWVDSDGNPCDTDREMDFSECGDVIATCSGDMKDTTPAASKRRKAFHGRAMAVVRTGATATSP